MTEKTTEKKKKVPYYRKPVDMTVEEWQIALRRQYIDKQEFSVQNIGDHPVFSDFQVYNPQTGNEYKVAIRSSNPGLNFCSCPDFSVNELGTCKHIEYVLKDLKENPKNNKHWKEGLIRPYSSLSLRYGNNRKIYLRIGTTNPEKIGEASKHYFNKDHFLKPEAFYFIEDFIERVKKYDPHFKVYEDALNFIINVREKNDRVKKLDEKLPDGIKSEYFKNLIKTNLYPYQKEGVLFAAKTGRVLIADDMGLGKTIQAIATIELLAKEFGISNVLIICPTSLKYQWKNEINKFTDRSIKVIEGHLDKRKSQYLSDEFYKIASYGVALNDIEYLNKMAPDLVILDEAQRIKNWKTKTAQNIKKLNSDFVIVLTGTPLENRLEELHSIVGFIDKFKLGALFRFLDNHQIKDKTGKIIGYKDLNQINKTLKDVLVRRTKSEISDQLPERIDKNYFVDVTKEQFEIHEDYAASVARLVFKWRKFGFLSEKDRQRLLIFLSCMRMVSDSTYILDQKTRHDTKIDELIIILKEIFENSDEKIVIFSQWERMTRLVGAELEKMNIEYEYLHGGVPSAKRKDLINNFTNDPKKRVFLSTDAGGVGLNLQAANVLINIDLPWNPAVLEQRIGRVHRLGQHKPVRIYNLISKGTIEERILGLIAFKKSVFTGVLDGGEDRVLMGESKFNKFMKSVETITKEVEDEKKDDIFGEENYLDETEKVEEISKLGKIDIKTKVTKTTADKDKKEIISERKPLETQPNREINELLTAGVSFFQKIGSAFADIQSGKIQISDFVEKDKETGQTSIKLPVKDEETVLNVMNSIVGMFKAFGK
ncbi:MAG TPA: ATP-dependent helicase [Candidatus Cloacimonetes bacterium]|nr:ATP-dependent helicase [Candidatus Cloacimonadota bacterium]